MSATWRKTMRTSSPAENLDLMPIPGYLIGIDLSKESSDLGFDRYWSSTKGQVSRPALATPFFNREDALLRLRKLRGNGASAVLVSRTEAPWLFEGFGLREPRRR